MRAGLRAFLQKNPIPSSLRIRTEEDEIREIALSELATRGRWKHAEDTIVQARAVLCECLDQKGRILRSIRLTPEVDDGGHDPAAQAADLVRRREDAAVTGSRRELAGVLDAYGRQINAAFQKGTESASQSQDSLVQLVEILTQHLTHAITNLHNVSVNLANVVQSMTGSEEPEEGSGNKGLLEKVLVAAAASRMGGGDAPAPPKTNGKAKTT